MENREVSISDLLNTVLKHIKVIVVVMIVGAILGFCYGKYMVVPMYQSTSKYFIDTAVITENSGGSSNKLTQTHNEVLVSRQIVSSYIGILNTMNFAETIANELAEDPEMTVKYNAAQLNRLVNYTYEEDLEIFKVSVTAFTPADAHKIAATIENNAEDYISTKMATAEGTLKIIDNARENPYPINTRTTLAVVAGVLVGAICVFFICYMIDIKDVSIKDEKSFSEVIGIPVIGSIPEYSTFTTKKQSKKNGKYSS